MRDQMQLIDRIALSPSRKVKEQLLRKLDKRILEYTYHPHKRYFLTPENKPPRNCRGTSNMEDIGFRVLDLLATGKYRGAAAKQLYGAYTNSLNPESRMLFNKILSKDLKCGVNVKTVNKVHPNLVPDEFCMLCTDYDADLMTYPCYAGIKIDGDRAVFWPDKGLFSRQGKRIQGLEHIERKLQRKGKTADMELRDPSLSFSVSSGLIRSNREKPNVRCFIFDSHIDTDLPFFKRVALTRELFQGIDSRIIVLPHVKCTDDIQVRVYYESAIAKGHEGIVIKKYDHAYKFKRSLDWARKVPIKTADVKVVDISYGKPGSKYENIVGALVVEFNNQIQRVGSGLNDAERMLFADDPAAIIGKVIEVEYKGMTDYGKMRQPRFKRIRYDKVV